MLKEFISTIKLYVSAGLFNKIGNIKNKYLWSKAAIRMGTYNLIGTEKVSSSKTILKEISKADEVLWIRNTTRPEVTTDLNHVGVLLDKIKKPIVLVTSDGDRSVPSSYDPELVKTLLSSGKIKKWYTQNYDRSVLHPKLSYYPIGLNLHSKKLLKLGFTKNFSKARADKFKFYLSTRGQNPPKRNMIFCDAHLNMKSPERGAMYVAIKNNPLVNFQNVRVHYTEIIKKYAEHRFVLSPRGNGLDCHRTWEAFLVGSVVVTKTSPLDKMYTQNNLPVIILDDYTDLNSISEADLDAWWEENSWMTDKKNILEKFNPRYWVSR